MAMLHDSDITRQLPLVTDSITRPSRDCPEPTILVAYVESTLGQSERTNLEEHLADCSYCLGQVGFLVRDAEREQPPVPSHLLETVQARRTPWFAWIPRPALTMLAAAAAVILAITVGIRLDWYTETEPSTESTVAPREHRTMRNGVTSTAGPQILEPQEDARVSGLEITLHWSETPQTLQYAVVLVNLQGDVIWEGRVADTRVQIPAIDLSPGERYFVWVEAHLRGGGSLKSSPVGFRVAAD